MRLRLHYRKVWLVPYLRGAGYVMSAPLATAVLGAAGTLGLVFLVYWLATRP